MDMTEARTKIQQHLEAVVAERLYAINGSEAYETFFKDGTPDVQAFVKAGMERLNKPNDDCGA